MGGRIITLITWTLTNILIGMTVTTQLEFLEFSETLAIHQASPQSFLSNFYRTLLRMTLGQIQFVY